MVEGKTKNGFEYKVDERIASDWRLVDAINKCGDADASIQLKGVDQLVNLVFGADERARLFEFIAKKNDGYIPTAEVTAMTTEILESIGQTKNSSSSPM